MNYPNNPTAAVAGLDYYKHLVEFAHKHGLIVVSDAAYCDLAFDGYKPPSILQVEGAKEVAIEFHSLSKTFNMTGWRVGFAAGNAQLVAGLGQVKSQIDSGAFDAVQLAGMGALDIYPEWIGGLCEMYQGRRDVLVNRPQGPGPGCGNAQGHLLCVVRLPPGGVQQRFHHAPFE